MMIAIPVTQLDESPLNPRKSYDPASLSDLADSLRETGLLQPLVVRAHPSDQTRYQIVCGHRRLRAAIIGGLQELDCVVKVLSDTGALHAMLAENSARRDVPPIEEADALQHLLRLGETVPDLEARLGRSRRWVSDRLALAHLWVHARELLVSGRLGLGSAVTLSRLTLGAQEAVIEKLETSWSHEQSWRHVSVIHAIRAFSRLLSDAPWDITQAQGPLPACAICPNQSGSQPSLFGDNDDDDGARCLDAACWARLCAAYVATAEACGAIIDHESWPPWGDVCPSDPIEQWKDSDGDAPTWGEVIPDAPMTVYARNGSTPVPSISKRQAAASLRARAKGLTGQDRTRYTSLANALDPPKTKTAKVKEPKHGAAQADIDALKTSFVEVMEKFGARRIVFQQLIVLLVEESWSHKSELVVALKRRGIAASANTVIAELPTLLAAMETAGPIGLLGEIIMGWAFRQAGVGVFHADSSPTQLLEHFKLEMPEGASSRVAS